MTPIQQLHRGHANHIAIYTAHESGLRPECGLPAWDLPRCFDGITTTLDQDSYYTINAFWHAPRRESRHKVGPARLVYAQRKEKQLQRINAAYADLDCHTLGMTPGQTIGHLIDLQDAKQIPPISMLTKSGRGVWCFWLVRDRDGYETHLGQRATRLAIRWTKAIQRAIVARLADLGADRQAMDLCRLTRIPGSRNTKSDTRVEYWIRRDSDGNVSAYSLQELGRWFDCPAPEQAPKPTGNPRHPNLLPAAEGSSRRWQREIERMTTLLRHRGRICEGQRAKAVYLWITFLRMSGLSGKALHAQAERIWPYLQNGDGCEHDFTRSQFEKQVDCTSLAKPSHQSISQMLSITNDESKLTGWPSRDHLTRPEKKAMRHAIIREVTRNGQTVPSAKRLSETLRTLDDRLTCDRSTVQRDLKQLGFSSGVQNSG